MLFANSDIFTSFKVGSFYFFIFLLWLLWLARIAKTMSNKSCESGHPCLVPDPGESAFSFSPLSMILIAGFSHGLYYVEECSFYVHFIKSSFFYHKWMLNFIKSFFCIYWDNHAFYCSIRWCDCLILWILKNLFIPRINPT